jgi:hypothetical protein
MSKKRPPKDVGKAISQGYQPMFMTGSEIKQNYKMYPGDREGLEEPHAWELKLREAKETGEKSARYSSTSYGNTRPKGINKVTKEAQEKGITPRSTLKKTMEKQGGTHGTIFLQERNHPSTPSYILGGHHRVALAAEQFKNVLQPVEYHPSISSAQMEEHYK